MRNYSRRGFTKSIFGAMTVSLIICSIAVNMLGQIKPLDEQTKSKLLSEIKNAIDTKAYVFGIDFTKWDEIIKKRGRLLKDP